MIFKLAWRNMRRSLRDYLIYFITLSLGIALFYGFNAIMSQEMMEAVDAYWFFEASALPNTFKYITAAITLVFAFLILYANRFLLKRRSREIGLLLCMGMDSSRLLGVFALELVFVSIAALALGLVLGIFGSQWLSLLIIKAVDESRSAYQFLFSASSLKLTLVYFVIIDLISILLIAISLRKFHLIDLIHPTRKLPQLSKKRTLVYLILFFASIVILVFAYQQGLNIEFFTMIPEKHDLGIPITLGLIGNFLLFFSIAGLISALRKIIPHFYYRQLRPFTNRQLVGRTRSSWLSLGTTAILLFLTFSILAAGLSMTTVTQQLADREIWNADYGMSLVSFKEPGEEMTYQQYEKAEAAEADIISDLLQKYPESKVRKASFHTLSGYLLRWSDGNSEKTDIEVMKDLLDAGLIFEFTPQMLEEIEKSTVALITWSEAEKIYPQSLAKVSSTERQNFAFLDCSDDIIGNFKVWQDNLKENYDGLTLAGKKLSLSENTLTLRPAEEEDYLRSREISRCLIVPDEFSSYIFENRQSTYMPVLFYLPEDLSIEEIGIFFTEFGDKNYDKLAAVDDYLPTFNYFDRSLSKQSSISLLFLTLILLYIGIIFLLTTVAILALQQLTEFYDKRYEYQLLSQLGADYSQIRKQIFSQTAAYFFLPLLVAAIHTLIGYFMIVGDPVIKSSGLIVGVLRSHYLLIVGVIVVFYLIYYLLTAFSGVRYILKSNNKQRIMERI